MKTLGLGEQFEFIGPVGDNEKWKLYRDADLFVSVASIGNDPSWIDHGANLAYPNEWRYTVARDY